MCRLLTLPSQTFELITGRLLFRHEPLKSDEGTTTPEQGHFAMLESFVIDRRDLDARVRLLHYFGDGEHSEKFFDREGECASTGCVRGSRELEFEVSALTLRRC